MAPLRLHTLLALTLAVAGCASLNYPTEAGTTSPLPSAEAGDPPSGLRPASPQLLDVQVDPATSLDPEAEGERGRAWYELTRQARFEIQSGRLEEAERHLDQAAIQLEGRPGTDAARRAVHGMRARLALGLAARGREDEARRLAASLFEEFETTPAIGGPATTALALHYAARIKAGEDNRDGGDEEPTETEANSTLDARRRMLRIAFQASEAEAPSLPRLNLAFETSQASLAADDFPLARRAIERAILDAQTLAPTDRAQLASLRIYEARIAIGAGDLSAAESAAIEANRIFEETDAGVESRAIGESTLARIVAERGDEARARAILAGALARIETEESTNGHVARTVLGNAARVERGFGDATAARAFFDRALAIPEVEFEPDQLLVTTLRDERERLEEARTPATPAPSEMTDAEQAAEREIEPLIETEARDELEGTALEAAAGP